VGGWLCLDFNNTIDWIGPASVEEERLSSYERLVDWGGVAGVLTHEEERLLLADASRRPDEARAVLRRARDLRATIHALLFAVIRGETPDASLLRSLNVFLAEVPAELRPAGSHEPQLRWGWPEDGNDLAAMLRPVAWSTAQLLTSPDLRHVQTCANDTCGWVFLDTSRKHNRRWCEMRTCGNREKARRFHERRRALGGGDGTP
jgi:predicted RNA-binding Zn ribbon-like protein